MKSTTTNATGSQVRHEPVFLAIGKLRRPHGTDGEWLMDVLSDFPERIQKGKEIYIGEEHIKGSIQAVRKTNKGMLIRLNLNETLNQAANWGNKILYTDTKTLPKLEPDHFYHHQIIGMKVVDDKQKGMGILSSILETGANDVYVVVCEGEPELLLPAISSVVLKIDVATNTMTVRKPEWI